MRANTRSTPGDAPGPRPTYSLGRTLVGTALLVAVFVGGLLAVSYPSTAVLVALVAVAAGLAGRTVRGRVRQRRETGQARQVCVPAAGVCFEA